MKLRYLFVSLLSAALLLAGCAKEDIINTLDGFKAESTYAIVPVGATSSTYTFTTDAAWNISIADEKVAEWLSVTPVSGSAGVNTVTLTATETDDSREGDFYITFGGKTQTVHVKQAAAETEPEILTVTEAVARIKAGTQGAKAVYVKGIVCRILEISVQYGNATYFLSDDGTYGDDNWLEVYRGAWLDGAKFTKGDEFALGDELLISGVLVYWNNDTPETSSGTCSVISVKKSLLSVEPTEISAPAEGTVADVAVTVKAGTLAFSSDSDWISVNGMDAADGATVVHVKVAENPAYEKRSGIITFSATSGSDVSSVSVTVNQAAAVDPAASAVYAKATKIASGKTYIIAAGNNMAKAVPAGKTYGYLQKEEIAVSGFGTVNVEYPDDEFVITAVEGGYTIRQADGRYLFQQGNFNNFNVTDTPSGGEVWTIDIADDGKATIKNVSVSKTVQYSSGFGSFGSYSTDEGELPVLYEKNDLSDGSEAHPFTISKAIEKCQELSSGSSTTEWYYVKGIFVRWNKDSDAFGANTYGNGTFWMSEDGANYNDKTKEFEGYHVNWFNNQKWVEGNHNLAVGDEVVMYCQLKNFNGTSENGGGYIYSVNGKKSEEEMSAE